LKKIKVIFPDGSIADIDESELQSALDAGAKRYTGSAVKKSVKFPDGSIAEIDDADINSAISTGASIVKKKEVTSPPSIPSSLIAAGTSVGTLVDSPIEGAAKTAAKELSNRTRAANSIFIPE
jgi:hypothetical protein